MIPLKRIILPLLFILIANESISQSLKFGELPLSVAYYGENAFHPGIKVGTYRTLWSAEKSKTYKFKGLQQKYGNKTKLRELNLDLNLGMYSHPNNHTGYFVATGLTFLRTKLRKNRQLGMSFEIGYLRRDYKFKTYELTEDGSFREIPGAGNNAIIFGLAPQFGKELTIAKKHIRIYCKPVFQLAQYGHSWQPNANLEIGTVININRKNK